MAKTYDLRCFELAAHFLFDELGLDTVAAKITLASGIQQFIETEIQFMREQMEKSNGHSR